jgi:hypothetical protein
MVIGLGTGVAVGIKVPVGEGIGVIILVGVDGMSVGNINGSTAVGEACPQAVMIKAGITNNKIAFRMMCSYNPLVE